MELTNNKFRTSLEIRIGSPGYNLLMILTVLGMRMDQLEILIYGLIVGIVIDCCVDAFRARKARTGWYALCVAAALLRLTRFLPLTLVLFVLYDQGGMHRFPRKLLESTLDRIDKCTVEAGLAWSAPISTKLTVHTRAEYLRDNGVSDAPIAIPQSPALKAAKIVETGVLYTAVWRVAVAILVSGFGLYISGILSAAAGVLTYLANEAAIKPNGDAIFRERAGEPIKNGTYVVNNYLFGLTVSRGIGVSWNNVLHVPYHVCFAKDIAIGEISYRAYFVSATKDLVTYGGGPQFSDVENDDELFVNCENRDSRTTYVANYDMDRDGGVLTWHSVTKPGESGSAVLVRRDDRLLLVALAGRFVRDLGRCQTEFAIAPLTANSADAAKCSDSTSYKRNARGNKKRRNR